MKLLGYMIAGVVAGPLLVAAIGYGFAFPWHVAALLAVPLAILLIAFLYGMASYQAPPEPDANQQAIDLLKPEQ